MIDSYAIKLKQLNRAYLELVRNWRNSRKVKSQMIYQKEISEDEQIQWFNALDKSHNYYFIIEHSLSDVGLVNIKDVKDRVGEAGIFIGDEAVLKTSVPVQAILAIMDFAFLDLDLIALRIKIRNDNQNAIELNTKLGYQRTIAYEEYSEYVISNTRYFETNQRFRKLFSS